MEDCAAEFFNDEDTVESVAPTPERLAIFDLRLTNLDLDNDNFDELLNNITFSDTSLPESIASSVPSDQTQLADLETQTDELICQFSNLSIDDSISPISSDSSNGSFVSLTPPEEEQRDPFRQFRGLTSSTPIRFVEEGQPGPSRTFRDFDYQPQRAADPAHSAPNNRMSLDEDAALPISLQRDASDTCLVLERSGFEGVTVLGKY